MPVTSFKIPENLLTFVDEVVASGAARNRTEVFIRALENFAKFQMHKWRPPLIFFHGMRSGFISRGTVLRLVSGMSDEKLFEAGRRMGVTAKETLLTEYPLNASRVENMKRVLNLLQESGWGAFRLADNNRIVVRDTFLHPKMLLGYLESALSVSLKLVETTNDEVHVFLMKVNRKK